MGIRGGQTLRLSVGVLVWALSVTAFAQKTPRVVEDPEVLLSIDVGYNTAYREKSWVPVDVVVVNELDDLTGWIEVRTYDNANRLQSPVYRMPVDCPKESRKRFRLHCYFDGAARAEAWIYDEKNRPAVEVPSHIIVQPIPDEDLLALIVDDDAINFGFLSSDIRGVNNELRIHRHHFNAQRLDQFPDFAECYKEFSFIVLGEIDPNRIPVRHRKLIRQYVEEGGTLIVTTGRFARYYRETWVQDLMGVSFGESQVMTDAAIAKAVFPTPERQRGAHPTRENMLATLTPKEPGMTTLGDSVVLATRRPLGKGQVYTLATDATSETLKGCVGFNILWSEMISENRRILPLNIEALSTVANQLLPSFAGVSIRPLSQVLLYLLLYIGIGVVGNWLFWSRLNRREYAWLCLVIFSVAFSAYAMYFGTAGWAEATKMHRIDIVRLPSDTNRAEHLAMVGILTARTSRYAGVIDQRDYLVRDAPATQIIGRYRNMGPAQPFTFMQADEPRIENLRVGASELRITLAEGSFDAPGTIEGEVVVGSERFTASIRNNTGWSIDQAQLLYEGAFLPLTRNGETWNLDMSASAVATHLERSLGASRKVASSTLYRRSQSFDQVRNSLQHAIFSHGSDIIYEMQPDADHGPYFVGWAKQNVNDVFSPDRPLTTETSQTIVIAEIEVVGHVSPYNTEVSGRLNVTSRFPLATSISTGQAVWTRGTLDDLPKEWVQSPHLVQSSSWSQFNVRSRDAMLLDPDSLLQVDLLWEIERTSERTPNPLEVVFTPAEGVDIAWHEEYLTYEGTLIVNGTSVRHQTYRIPNWRDYRDTFTDSRTLVFGIQALYADQRGATFGADGRPINAETGLPLSAGPFRNVKVAIVATGYASPLPSDTEQETVLPWQ